MSLDQREKNNKHAKSCIDDNDKYVKARLLLSFEQGQLNRSSWNAVGLHPTLQVWTTFFFFFPY